MLVIIKLYVLVVEVGKVDLVHHVPHPKLINSPLASAAPILLNPSARTWLPLRSRCNPTATFQLSVSCRTKRYFLPSWSLILARRIWRPLNSPLCISKTLGVSMALVRCAITNTRRGLATRSTEGQKGKRSGHWPATDALIRSEDGQYSGHKRGG